MHVCYGRHSMSTVTTESEWVEKKIDTYIVDFSRPMHGRYIANFEVFSLINKSDNKYTPP